MENREHVTDITIPDEDMPGWIEALRNSDLTNEEIDEILENLNLTYAKENGGVEKMLAEIEARYQDEHKYFLNDEQKAELREILEKKFEKK